MILREICGKNYIELPLTPENEHNQVDSDLLNSDLLNIFINEGIDAFMLEDSYFLCTTELDC